MRSRLIYIRIRISVLFHFVTADADICFPCFQNDSAKNCRVIHCEHGSGSINPSKCPLMATLILICGMAGAGKSTLAKQMEASRHALRLCPDEWIKAVIGVETDRAEVDRLRAPVESLQWDLARKLLKHGMTVILENGFWSKEERIALRTRAMELEAGVELHYLNIPSEELRKRLQKRNAWESNPSFIVTEKDLETWMSWFTPPDAEEISGYRKFYEYRVDPVLR